MTKIAKQGRTLEFTFPEMPETLHAKYTGKRIPAQMVAALPRNYNARRLFPLLVYLNGGAGESGKAMIKYIRKISGDRDFIAVSLPLFKKRLDREEMCNGLMICREDYALISRCYRRMLKELFREIPNVMPGNGSLGGISNGAHTTAVLLSHTDRFILSHFRNFFFLEGGWELCALQKRALHDKNYLYFIGGKNPGIRRSIPKIVKLIQAGAQFSDINLSVRTMPGVGHAFPDEYIGELTDWLREVQRFY